MSDNPILKIMLLAVTCSPTATGQLHVERHGHEDAKSDPTWPPNDQQEDELGDFLAVSPYTTLPHLLDLRPLEGSERLLAKALAVLEPVREDYATSPYAEAFNWDEVIDRLQSLMQLSKSGFEWKHQYFYIVVFRSQIPTTTDRRHLGELDQQSHAEATKSGGLLKYWYGLPDESGRNLATCIWRRCEDARPASAGPGHKEAMRATINLYSEWKLERFKFDIGEGARTWSFTSWEY